MYRYFFPFSSPHRRMAERSFDTRLQHVFWKIKAMYDMETSVVAV